MAFIYFLGGSLRAATVNFTPKLCDRNPLPGPGSGWKGLKAEKFYHKAMFDVALGRDLSPIEIRMLDEMINKGIPRINISVRSPGK